MTGGKAGKGDTPRPMTVSQALYDLNWEYLMGNLDEEEYTLEKRKLEGDQDGPV